MRHTPLGWSQRVRHHGMQLWHTARHVGSELDRHIQTAAYLYGRAIQPGLRAAGVDTREVDKHLITGYGHYSKLRENLNDGVQVIDGVAHHLRGGTYQYR